MTLTDAQREQLERVEKLAHDLQCVNELNPNADELIVAYYDLGRKAATGATSVVQATLDAVERFLNSLFDGE